MSERLPAPEIARIARTAPEVDDLVVLPIGTRLVRLHPLGGAHPRAWDELRRFGPTDARFDHHPPPPRSHRARAIAYVATGPEAFTTAIAEWFQDGDGRVGPIQPAHQRVAITLLATRAELRVLDLDGGWITRARGNQAIRTGPRAGSRRWAQAIHRAHPQVQGLAYGSSLWGPGRCIALWERSRSAWPTRPEATRLLDDPALRPALLASAEQLGTIVV